jgi:putative FmdB family regulatory protein
LKALRRKARLAVSSSFFPDRTFSTMPIYAYKCESCGHAKDILRKISDPPLSECPQCGASTFVKQVTAAGFQLKGSGWYVTDFRGGNSAAAAPKPADGGDAPAPTATASTADGGASASPGPAAAPAPAASSPAPAPAVKAAGGDSSSKPS